MHGLAQDGGVFAPLAERLAGVGHRVVAVDLRGHGGSDHEPPWSTERHAADVLETVADHGVRRATWIGHGFGGRVAAATAALATDLTAGLVLLDPGLEVAPERALRSAEADRLDWSFEAPLGFCPGAVVTAWSEMCLPAPPVPTLVVCPPGSLFTAALEERCRRRCGRGNGRRHRGVGRRRWHNGRQLRRHRPRLTVATSALTQTPSLLRLMSHFPPSRGGKCDINGLWRLLWLRSLGVAARAAGEGAVRRVGAPVLCVAR